MWTLLATLVATLVTTLVTNIVIKIVLSTICEDIIEDFASTNEDALQSGVMIRSVDGRVIVITETSSLKKIDYFLSGGLIIIGVHIRFAYARGDKVIKVVKALHRLKVQLTSIELTPIFAGDFNSMKLNDFQTLDGDIGVTGCGRVELSEFVSPKLEDFRAEYSLIGDVDPRALFNALEEDGEAKKAADKCLDLLVYIINSYMETINKGALPTDHSNVKCRLLDYDLDIIVVGLAGVANGRFTIWPIMMRHLFGLLRHYKKKYLSGEELSDDVYSSMKNKLCCLGKQASSMVRGNFPSASMFNVYRQHDDPGLEDLMVFFDDLVTSFE